MMDDLLNVFRAHNPAGWRVAMILLNLLVGVIAWTIRSQVHRARRVLGDMATDIRATQASVQDTVSELRTLNGRMLKMEQRQQDHEREDRDRHEDVRTLQHVLLKREQKG